VPRGAWPRSQIYDRFDRYKLLEMTARCRWSLIMARVPGGRRPAALGRRRYASEGRERLPGARHHCPAGSRLQDLPDRYLPAASGGNLQSLSVATGRHGETLTDRFLRFCRRVRECGVTAIRTVGRRLSPSCLLLGWPDPLDLVHRPVGRFTNHRVRHPLRPDARNVPHVSAAGMEVGALNHVLVTGATGFIGGHVAAELLRRGYRVRTLVRDKTDPGHMVALGAEGWPVAISWT